MDLDALGQSLTRVGHPGLELEPLYRRHREGGGDDDRDGFLAFLLREGRIGPEAFASLSSDATVIVTGRLPGPMSEMDVPTVLERAPSSGTGAADLDAPTLFRGQGERPGPVPAASPGGGSSHYVVLGTAGKGSMGTVSIARDVDLLRKVALKELAPEFATDRSAMVRFVREVQVTAQLDHPHIVPVYSLEQAPGGRPAYAMKLVEGRTFLDLIRETQAGYEEGRTPGEPLSLPARLEYFLKVCDAVHYAHERGVIHRDLKPANLMLGRYNEVYVMDWGICRLLGRRGADDEEGQPPVALQGGGTGETHLGDIVGTPRYMPPEQAQGRNRELDARSDQCALGLILYELVTLRAPFEGQSALDFLRAAAAGRRRPVVHAYESAPVAPELGAVIERATAKDPGHRYQSVRAFADDLRRYLRGEAVLALPDTQWQKLLRALARHRQAVAVGLFALITVATIAVLGLLYRHERALGQQRFREERTQVLVFQLERQGERLQARLLDLEGELKALTTAAGLVLQEAKERPSAVSPPEGLAGSAFVSGAWTAAPGIDEKDVRPLAWSLARLDRYEKGLFESARAVLGAGAEPGPGMASEASAGIVELRIGLEAGLGYRYPAPAGRTRAEDPRREEWYRSAAGWKNPHWGTPFVGAESRHVLLPLTAPIRAADGRLLGVVSMRVSTENLVTSLEREGTVPDARATYVLDSEGRVLAAKVQGMSPAARLEPFPEAKAIGDRELECFSHVRTNAFGRSEVLAFDRVKPLDWILVVTVPEDRLFATP